jgi:hypothetical protein
MENTKLVEEANTSTTKQEAQTTKAKQESKAYAEAKQSEMRRRMAAFSDCC